MFTNKWEAQFTDEMFANFQDFCRDIGFRVPQNVLDLACIDNYNFADYLQKYTLSYDEIDLVSKCIHLDKYYVSKLIDFPEMYLYEPNNKEYSDMSVDEKREFLQRANDAVFKVCQNQAELFNHDVGTHLLDVHVANWQQKEDVGLAQDEVDIEIDI